VQASATPNHGWGSPQNRPNDDYDYNRDAERRERAVDQRFIKQEPPRSGGFGGINAGVGGGVLMMAIAVVWFFGALIFADTIFFYPPILFILGLIAFFKGMVSAAR
jgi:hypothetical protein